MFGHQDDNHDDHTPVAAPDTAVVSPEPQQHDEPAQAAATTDDWQHPGIPASDDLGSDDVAVPTTDDQVVPATDVPVEHPDLQAAEAPVPDGDLSHDVPTETPEAPVANTPVFDVSGPAGDYNPPANPSAQDDNNHDLIDLKQKALQGLTPLVNHLDQAPEERFRTLMMVIQSNDDQSLLKEAHAEAEKIQDDKVRAQALLDVVNEINYFTQPHQDA